MWRSTSENQVEIFQPRRYTKLTRSDEMKRQLCWKWKGLCDFDSSSDIVSDIFWLLCLYHVTDLIPTDVTVKYLHSATILILSVLRYCPLWLNSLLSLASNSLILSTFDLYKWGVGQNPWYYWLMTICKTLAVICSLGKNKARLSVSICSLENFLPNDDDDDYNTDDETRGCAVWWMIKNGAKTAWGCLSVRLLQPVCSDFIRQIQIQIWI